IGYLVAFQPRHEGGIARAGNFAGLSGRRAALEYWRLSGGEPAGERCPVGGDDPAALIDRVIADTVARIDRFDDPATPYPPVPDLRWAPRFSDYRHLARLDEAEIEADAEGEPGGEL